MFRNIPLELKYFTCKKPEHPKRPGSHIYQRHTYPGRPSKSAWKEDLVHGGITVTQARGVAGNDLVHHQGLRLLSALGGMEAENIDSFQNQTILNMLFL